MNIDKNKYFLRGHKIGNKTGEYTVKLPKGSLIIGFEVSIEDYYDGEVIEYEPCIYFLEPENSLNNDEKDIYQFHLVEINSLQEIEGKLIGVSNCYALFL